LAIVRDLSQLYGGAVRLDQSELGGLRVVLELPGSFDDFDRRPPSEME
jgi:signal transduction histidine kinase